MCEQIFSFLTVGLGNSFQLVLLLDGVRVGGTLGGVDQLVSQALGDRLDVVERGLAGSGAQQPDGLQNEHTSWILHRGLEQIFPISFKAITTQTRIIKSAKNHIKNLFFFSSS